MSRKAISKKLRFEVFKRDSFTCQYCGATPPQAILEVDHIDPIALGGGNDIDNLTTACFPCNRGKRDNPLTSVPQSLADKAAEVAEREEQLAGYQAILRARRERIEDDVWTVFDRWGGQTKTSHERFNSVKRFIEMLGLDEVLDAVDITLAKGFSNHNGEFKYFCGVCWKKARGE